MGEIDKKEKEISVWKMEGSGSGCTTTVCVTGGGGYISSWIVKKLLLKGHTVHATVRNLQDESKLGLIKSFPNAATKLLLFQADIYQPDQFQEAIRGCEFVFHIATPLTHNQGSQYTNRTEASVAAAKMIAKFCVESGTVRRLIYTASVVSTSPMKEDGTGFKDFIDETCWTPLNLSYPYSNDTLAGYTDSKTQTERELLRFGESEEAKGLEVVTLPCGLVAGDTLQSFTAVTNTITISQFTEQAQAFNALKFLEELDGKVPLVHVEDVSEAHIFCMEQSSIHGRFLCASSYLSTSEIANYYRLHHPELQQIHGDSDEVPARDIEWKSRKLIEKGFKYKYDAEMLLEDALECSMKKIRQAFLKLWLE